MSTTIGIKVMIIIIIRTVIIMIIIINNNSNYNNSCNINNFDCYNYYRINYYNSSTIASKILL